MRTSSLLAWLAFVVTFVALVSSSDAAASSRKRRKKSKIDVDANNFYSGVTPSGSTKWRSESKGVIYTTIDTSHLNFDRVPKYFCSVVDSSRAYTSSRINATVLSSEAVSVLTNVTGKNKPVRVTNSGFRVRLKFTDETGRDLTESDARIGGWRVRWAAVSEPHSSFEAARKFVENDKYDTGIEDKPVGEALAYVEMLRRLAVEEPQMVQGILGADYVKPMRMRPKPKPAKASSTDADASSSESADVDDSAPEPEVETQ